MKTLVVLVGAVVLALVTTIAAQAPTLSARKISLIVVENTTFASVVEAVAVLSGVTIEFDASIPMEVRDAPVERVHFEDTAFESALQFLTNYKNLTFRVSGPTSVRIEAKPAAARR